MKRLINFTKDESGAVTVDWVVLTAAIVGIAIAVISLISGGLETASEGINGELQTASAVTLGGSSGDSDYAWNEKTYNDYADEAFANMAENGGVIDIHQDIANDAPSGYGYSGYDNNDGHPIYVSQDGTSMISGGVETSTAGTDYDGIPNELILYPQA